MKFSLLLIPVALVFLPSCDLSRAMDCNRCAIQRSTKAIDRNVEALEKVTHNLKSMQEEG